MNMSEWAKKEIELACKRENPDRKEGEWDYGCACYESALKAFESLLEDDHSGFSIGITKNILNRLIDGKCLTPIEDTEDVWYDATYKSEYKTYQCNRMTSLFKDVYEDGTVKYYDVDRIYGIDIENNIPYHNGFISSIVDELYPVETPYMPESEPFRVYTEDFLYDPKNGDYDTQAVFYMIKPDGEREEINRFFTEKGDGFAEISKEEYYRMKSEVEERRMKDLKDRRENK